VRRPNWTLLGSAVLYVLARWFDWNFASYPPGTTWYFNPFAWQLLFIFAAWCGVGGAAQLQFLIRSRVVLAMAVAWILFALLIVMTWHVPFLESLVPKWMIKAIYPIDKTDLLLRDCLPLFEKLLPDRLTIERLYFAQLAGRKIVGIDGGDAIDHRGIVWSKRIYYHRHHCIVVALNLRPVLYQRGLKA
jgi:hypothetical protein